MNYVFLLSRCLIRHGSYKLVYYLETLITITKCGTYGETGNDGIQRRVIGRWHIVVMGGRGKVKGLGSVHREEKKGEDYGLIRRERGEDEKQTHVN